MCVPVGNDARAAAMVTVLRGAHPTSPSFSSLRVAHPRAASQPDGPIRPAVHRPARRGHRQRDRYGCDVATR